jgi:eukaryotic-like serine/threonine-protein kinase
MTLPVTAEHWHRALSLMDSTAPLSADAREAWLDALNENEPAVAPLLRKLLSARRRVETGDLLATLPAQPQPSALNTSQIGAHIGMRIGPFALLELVGHGGMGSVWRAHYADGRVKRDVAIKLPALLNNPDALVSLRERFARERDFLAQLEHPNIARLYDTGVADTGQPYLAMEFVNGQPIDSYCDHAQMGLKARIALFLQVVDAVGYAHQQLVLHRDLKPSNVLVDGKGQVRLLDFGVAKLLPTDASMQPAFSNDLTELAGAAITLAYAAPEQINHGTLSTATDVYALGVMLHRLLTGLSPYQPSRDTRGALEDAVLNSVPANAASRVFSADALSARQTTAPALKKSLQGDLDVILNKALKKRNEDRYPTAQALAADLRAHLNKQPIQAHPDSLWYRSQRFIARHRVAVAGSALGLAALVTSTGVAVWQAGVANQSAAQATKEAARSAMVQKFLAGIFSNSDPQQNKGANVTAKEILDRGLTTAEKDLAADPEALSLVLAQIGDIYYRLGLPADYLGVAKKRVAVLEAFAGADVDALIDARLALGQSLGDSHDASERSTALAHLTAAQQMADARSASADRRVWALALIADEHRVAKRLPAAREFAERAEQLALATLKAPDRYLAAAHLAVATVARDQGRFVEARAAFAKTNAIDATGLGRGKLDQALTMTDIANMEYDAGDYARSAEAALRVIDFVTRELGEVQVNLSAARRTAVFATERGGDFDGAQRLVTQLLPQELAATDAVRSGAAHMARGRVAMSLADFVTADESFTVATDRFKDRLVWAGRLAALRAELLLRQGNAEAARDLLVDMLAKQLKQFGSESPEIAATAEWLGVSYARLGDTAFARAQLENSCRLRAKIRAPEHPQRVRCESYLLLLDDTINATQRSTALHAMEQKLVLGRSDRTPLIASLQAARATQDSAGVRPSLNNRFPILN